MFVRYGCYSTNTSTPGCMSFKSDIILDYFRVAYAANSGRYANGAFIIPVGTQRFIEQQISKSAFQSASDRFVGAFAYRRIGTNN